MRNTADEANVPPRRGQRVKAIILPPFNGGNAFQLVECDMDDGDRRHGIVERRTKQTSRVWLEFDVLATEIPNDRVHPVALPDAPSAGYSELTATIGGIGKHTRWSVILPNQKCKESAALRVTNIHDRDEFRRFVDSMLRPFGLCRYEYDADGATEVEVLDPMNVGIVAAGLHCGGYVATVTKDIFSSGAKLAPERYDRSEHMWWNQDQRVAGPLRDVHRWNFDFIPSTWKIIPFTWQSLCENLTSVPSEAAGALPLPLRDYFVTMRAERSTDDDEKARLLRLRGRASVTCRLSASQNFQLLNATYWNTIAPFNPTTVKLAQLVRFRYMIHGYTSREVGGYRQTASHLGHGANIRTFRNKPQYRRENLSAEMINQIYQADGTLRGTGFKGTRGKYGHKDFPRYEPRKRMKRTKTQEARMRQVANNCFAAYRMQASDSTTSAAH